MSFAARDRRHRHSITHAAGVAGNDSTGRRDFLRALCALPALPALSAIPLLSSCASTTPDPNARADIALITVPMVSKLSLTIDKHPDTTTSIERALMFQGDVELGINRLTEAQRGEPSAGPQQLASLSATIEREMLAALRARGRSVVTAVDKHTDRIELLSNYPSFNARADRIVDVLPKTIGFWSTYPDRIYRAWVRVEYRVFDTGTAKNVATGAVGTGVPFPDVTWTGVTTDDRFVFATFEDLVAQPARAAAALQDACARVGRTLATTIG